MSTTDSVEMIDCDRRNSTRVKDRDGHEHESLGRRLLSYALTAAVVAFTIYLWPAMLGGSTRLVVVSGRSMEPTYDLLDIVVARDAGNTAVGDVVVFAVPDGPAEGMLIIHRVLEIDDEGFFITQGDNRDTPDQWQLTEDDIVGKPLAHIPKGGNVLGFIQNIWVIALFVGLVVLFVLWPDEDDELDEPDERDEAKEHVPSGSAEAGASGTVSASTRNLSSTDITEAIERDAEWTLVATPFVAGRNRISRSTEKGPTPEVETDGVLSVDELAERWLDDALSRPIDDEVTSEAVVWLDEQLASITTPVHR